MNLNALRKHCSELHPISNIKSITTDNKVNIGEHYKCLFEGNNQDRPFTEEDDFIETAIRLFPLSKNGDFYSCLEENGDLSHQNPPFYFDFINCLVRESIDGSEQYCLYRNKDPISFFECLQEQTTDNGPDEFKEQSMEYAYRVSGTTYETCRSARNSQSFVSCIRQAGQERSKTAQKECDIDFSQFDLKTIVNEEREVIGNGYKCALNKLNIRQLPTVYPSLELFYKKDIQAIANCVRSNSFVDDWSFYFKFAKCAEA